MASIFKKRLRCFYCGRRSTQSQKGPVRQFKCPECQAVNYLDENGEITDPPVSAAARVPSAQYAHPLPRSDSQEPTSDSAIFCSTCVKNQYLFTQTLASYLPPQSHPEYEAYEASYPAYKRSLEERYPQVCAQCEPRVRNRIRQAGYAAKSDHLRRMMDRSRGRHARRHAWGWRSLLVSLGAVTFWTSVAGQLAWNIMGSLIANDSMREEPEALSLSLLTSCVNTALKRQNLGSQCSTALEPYAGVSLCLGALSIWWNPRLRHKVDGRGGRLKGLGEYYKIQIVVLVVRFMAWAGLQDPSITGLNPKLSPAVHIFMFIFTAISVVVSRSVVKFDTTPLVSWNDNIEPLVPQMSKSQVQPNQQLVTPPDSQATHLSLNSASQRFPISSLAPTQPSEPEPYNPPTPPIEPVDDADLMDWTPSQQTSQLNLTPKHLPAPQVQGPSPFQGQLPAAPKPLSWQLRNPASRAAQQPVEDKLNPFHQSHNPQRSNSESGKQSASSDMLFAPPKFFPPSDFAADTGLENLFDKTFSLSDDPSDIKKKPWLASTTPGSPGVNGSGRSSSILKSTLLSACLLLWIVAHIFPLPRNFVEASVLGITFLVAGFTLLESLMKPMALWSATDVLLSLFELIACGCLATYLGHETYDLYRFDKVDKCLVAFMTGQQMLTLQVFSPNGRNVPSAVSQTTEDAVGKQSPSGVAIARSSDHTKSLVNNDNKINQHPSRNDTVRSNPSNDFAVRQNRQINATHDSSTVHPAPFSSIPRSQQSQPLSFSLGSALPDNLMSPSSAASVSSASYASSVISDPPSPQKQSFHTRGSRGTPGPSIGGLSLDDGPVIRTTRYPLRGRRA